MGGLWTASRPNSNHAKNILKLDNYDEHLFNKKVKINIKVFKFNLLPSLIHVMFITFESLITTRMTFFKTLTTRF
jgi:hypothetical protein